MPAATTTLSNPNRRIARACAIVHKRNVTAIQRIRNSYQERDVLDKQLESSRAATAALEQEIARVVTEREVIWMLEALRGAEEEGLEAGVKMRGMGIELEGTWALAEGTVVWEMYSFLCLVVVVLMLLVGFFSSEWEWGSDWYGRSG